MKKVFCVSVVCLLIATIGIWAFASDNEMASLGNLSDAELLAFLNVNGVEIPELYENPNECLPFVRVVIERIETSENRGILYECYSLIKFANDIENAVHNYYGNLGIVPYLTSRDNIIEDSTVHGVWINEYRDYNAYGYAIGIEEWILPGISSWLLQNETAETYHCNGYASMSNIANWVCSDLEYYGNVVNAVSTTMPTLQTAGHTQIIAIRKDMDEREMLNRLGNWEYNHAIHIMRLDKDGNWYHKPLGTNPLKYKYTPTNERAWIHEGYVGNICEYFRYDDFTYESEIYFIEYTTPHTWEYVFFDSGQHIERCTICGEEKLGDCQWTDASYVGLDSHQFTCELCGGLGGTEACTIVYEGGYSLAEADAHWRKCTVCEHVYSEALCTFEYTDNGDDTHTATCTVCNSAYVHDNDYPWRYSGSGSTHTHTKTCTYCDYTITESCTMVIQYNGQVDGNNTHISACSVCGYSPFGVAQCMYNSDNLCRFCGVHKDYVPVNRVEEESLEE